MRGERPAHRSPTNNEVCSDVQRLRIYSLSMARTTDVGAGAPISPRSANAAGIRVDVKKIAKGVTITYTSEDASAVTRLQKRADAVRLMHESCSP